MSELPIHYQGKKEVTVDYSIVTNFAKSWISNSGHIKVTNNKPHIVHSMSKKTNM